MKGQRHAMPESGRPVSAGKTAVILVGSIGGAVAGLVLFLVYAIPDTDTVVSGHGTVAMALGVVFSLVVGIGLMGLVFYSSRRGYDEDASGRPPAASPPQPGSDE